MLQSFTFLRQDEILEVVELDLGTGEFLPATALDTDVLDDVGPLQQSPRQWGPVFDLGPACQNPHGHIVCLDVSPATPQGM